MAGSSASGPVSVAADSVLLDGTGTRLLSRTTRAGPAGAGGAISAAMTPNLGHSAARRNVPKPAIWTVRTFPFLHLHRQVSVEANAMLSGSACPELGA